MLRSEVLCPACNLSFAALGVRHGCSPSCRAACPPLMSALGCPPEEAIPVCFNCRSTCSLLGCAARRRRDHTRRPSLHPHRPPRPRAHAPPLLPQHRFVQHTAHVLQRRVPHLLPRAAQRARLPGRHGHRRAAPRAHLWARRESLPRRDVRARLRGLCRGLRGGALLARLLLGILRRQVQARARVRPGLQAAAALVAAAAALAAAAAQGRPAFRRAAPQQTAAAQARRAFQPAVRPPRPALARAGAHLSAARRARTRQQAARLARGNVQCAARRRGPAGLLPARRGAGVHGRADCARRGRGPPRLRLAHALRRPRRPPAAAKVVRAARKPPAAAAALAHPAHPRALPPSRAAPPPLAAAAQGEAAPRKGPLPPARLRARGLAGGAGRACRLRSRRVCALPVRLGQREKLRAVQRAAERAGGSVHLGGRRRVRGERRLPRASRAALRIRGAAGRREAHTWARMSLLVVG